LRQRKDEKGESVYSQSIMDAQTIHPNLIVAEALALGSQATEVFISMRTDCVGCMATRFCTLHDVARDYALDLELLMENLRAATPPPISPKENA